MLPQTTVVLGYKGLTCKIVNSHIKKYNTFLHGRDFHILQDGFQKCKLIMLQYGKKLWDNLHHLLYTFSICQKAFIFDFRHWLSRTIPLDEGFQNFQEWNIGLTLTCVHTLPASLLPKQCYHPRSSCWPFSPSPKKRETFQDLKYRKKNNI